MPTLDLTLIQMNDSHAYLDLHQELFWYGHDAVYRPAGGYARIATLVRQIRAEVDGRALFCDCGDTFHGTYPAVHSKGEALLPILNALGLDAMTAHWDFAYGPQQFRTLVAGLNYPMLAANVFDQATGRPVFPQFLIKEVGGVRVGLIGIASNIVDKTMPRAFSEGIYFTLGKDELPPLIARLREREGVDLVVLISHLGFPQDVKLLSEVQGIDICLSGHTHNRLSAPAQVGSALIIQSGCHGSFIGRLDVRVAERKIVSHTHRLIEVAGAVAPDPEVAELVGQALAPYREQLATVVGETLTPLHRATTLESTMDNFLLQTLLDATGAELAFSNGWRYGAPVPSGSVVLNDLYNMIPMDPPISTVTLTGAEIRQLLEQSLERVFAADPYQQMGGYVKRVLGVQVYFKIENPPGLRIQEIFVGGESLEAEREYSAAYVTVQGVPKNFGRDHTQRDMHIVPAMQTYLRRHGPLRAELRNTFVVV